MVPNLQIFPFWKKRKNECPENTSENRILIDNLVHVKDAEIDL